MLTVLRNHIRAKDDINLIFCVLIIPTSKDNINMCDTPIKPRIMNDPAFSALAHLDPKYFSDLLATVVQHPHVDSYLEYERDARQACAPEIYELTDKALHLLLMYCAAEEYCSNHFDIKLIYIAALAFPEAFLHNK